MSKYNREDPGISAPRFALFAAITVAALIIFDRITKILAVTFLKGTDGVDLIKGVLKLSYLENRGAAWGMLQGMQWVFFIITLFFIVASLIYFIRVPKNRYYMPLSITVAVLLSGALGNFIDRIVNQYVIDFIYFEIIDFPVFNVADIYVTLSIIALLILVIFKYKDGDFFFLSRKKKTDEQDMS